MKYVLILLKFSRSNDLLDDNDLRESNCNWTLPSITLSNVDAGETAPTPVTTVLSLQNLMDANKFLVLFNVI